MIRRNVFPVFVLSILTGTIGFSRQAHMEPAVPSKPPGVVIDYLPSRLKNYVGSPSIAILPNGRYVASHDVFGDGPESRNGPHTLIFESVDSGRMWRRLAKLTPQFWSKLFVHRGELYIIGIGRGDIIIRRSTDGGKTWTQPRDGSTGLLAEGRFHCAPVPVVVHEGRIWRAFEVNRGRYKWDALVMSAPVDADLLNADNWLMSKKCTVDKRANIFKWLEGNVVVTPDGRLVNILRTQKPPARAAMIHISDDGRELNFDPNEDMIDFPGGAKKFTIRYDKVTGKYWSLVNIITDPGPLEEPPQDHRNTLALTCSKDLRNWEVRYIALSFRKGEHLTKLNNKFGFQYIDWLIEGGDIIFVSRTAWGWETPRSHDANYFTFHRIPNFRRKTLGDKPLDTSAEQGQAAVKWRVIIMIRTNIFTALAFGLCTPFTLLANGNSEPIKPTVSKVPGVVINYSPSESGIYLGCPGIAVLPNGRYVASHSFYGPASKKNRMAVFCSGDSGKTWQHLTDLVGQWWSTLFVHRGRLYIIGVNKSYGDIVIRRSTDGGETWTEPKSKTRGLLLKGNYHCAPVPVVVHKGRIWRAFEEKGWKAFVMSAPADADLLNADNWTVSNRLPVDKEVVGKKWLEGNVVVTRRGGLVNILRTQPRPARAAVLDISPDGRKVSFDAKEGIIDFPGANKKFTIRYDRLSGKYWSLVNIVTDPGPLELDANEHRNTLALTCSKDLKNWQVRYIPLSFMKGEHLTHKNNKFGFQYIDWLIEGDDIIFVSRTAWGWDTPRSHDANYFTFHRIPNFRKKTLSDKPLDTSAE
jgi:photosystem II stability/assembly factor-like uncharacterized protein